jgi:hypothetical protein
MILGMKPVQACTLNTQQSTRKDSHQCSLSPPPVILSSLATDTHDITALNHCHETLYAYTTAMRITSPHLVGIQLAIQACQLAVHEVAGRLRLPHQQQLRQGKAFLAGLDAPQAQVGLGEAGSRVAESV